MSIRELKETIEKAGLSHAGIAEKADLVKRAEQALQTLKKKAEKAKQKEAEGAARPQRNRTSANYVDVDEDDDDDDDDEVEVVEESENALLNKQVAVVWADQKYHPGKVLKFKAATGKHLVEYDGGEQKWHALNDGSTTW